MSIILSILGWVVANPMMILAAIGVFVATSWISDIKGYFQKRDQAVQWAQVVDSRDQAAAQKDRLIEEALRARDNAKADLQKTQADLDAAEIARKAAGVPDCVWSDSDVGVLNNAKRRK